MKSPLYGYDNAEEIDRDVMYMKKIYPRAVKKIQSEIEEECDKLEYEGSCMFDETPDCTRLGAIVDTIYKRVSDLPLENAEIKTEELHGPGPAMPYPPNRPGCPGGRPCRPPFGPPCAPGHKCPPPPPRPDYRPNGQPDWMRGLISSLLYNEMVHRRRRYRSRHQWN